MFPEAVTLPLRLRTNVAGRVSWTCGILVWYPVHCPGSSRPLPRHPSARWYRSQSTSSPWSRLELTCEERRIRVGYRRCKHKLYYKFESRRYSLMFTWCINNKKTCSYSIFLVYIFISPLPPAFNILFMSCSLWLELQILFYFNLLQIVVFKMMIALADLVNWRSFVNTNHGLSTGIFFKEFLEFVGECFMWWMIY